MRVALTRYSAGVRAPFSKRVRRARRAGWLSPRISYKYICTNGVHARGVYGTHVALLTRAAVDLPFAPRAAEGQLRRLDKRDD